VNHTSSRIGLLVAGLAAAMILMTTTAKRADAQVAGDAIVIAGVDQDTTAIGRLLAGGLYGFGKFAVEAHVAFEGFLRINTSKGVSGRSLPSLDLGMRYGIKSDKFVGPFVAAGASLGFFTGKPHERKVVNDPDTCATASDPNDCAFNVDRNASLRFGMGWGFKQSDKVTVAIRLDIAYWMFSVSPFENQPMGSPIPREIPRPQDSYSVMIGLEFMRWM